MEEIVKKGFFAGIAVIAIYSLAYAIRPSLYFEFGLGFLTYLVNLGWMAWAVQSRKALEDGLVSFYEALKIAFLVIVISNLLFFVYDYCMNNFIAPELPMLAQAFAMEKLVHYSEMFGAELTDEVLANIEQSFEEGQNQTLSSSLLAFFQSLIGGFAGSALIAMVLKNKRNENKWD
jgi:hypothetical protein